MIHEKNRELRSDEVPKHAVSTYQIDKAIMWRWEDLTDAERAEVHALEAGKFKTFRCRNLCGFTFTIRFIRKHDGSLCGSGQITQTLNMSEYDK